MRPVFILFASLVLVAIAGGVSLAARPQTARSSFVVATTIVDACAVTLEGNAIRAACAPESLAQVTASSPSALAHGLVSLVPGGAPMRVASAVEGRTQVITFSF